MENGEVIAFNKVTGKGFILNANSNLSYLFENYDCIDEIKVGDHVIFEPYDIKEAVNIQRTANN